MSRSSPCTRWTRKRVAGACDGTSSRSGAVAERLAGDSLGRLTLHEAVLATGEAAQTNTLRWEDYSQTAVDPSDDCTIWYVGDYLKQGATSYSTRIGGF